MKPIPPPFPWFGGKSKVAHLVWQRFGDVPNYVEPFAGSLSVLLNRPHEPGIETVNDLDCYLSNFWRALANDHEGLHHWADWPVNEADLHARHWWLVQQVDFREQMKSDPDFYDVKIAGWWVWGICQWIGSGWCDVQQLPHLGNPGRGIHRPSQQRPHLGDAGRGIHRPSQQRPHLGDAGRVDLYDYLFALSARLRKVRVCCGDWSRVMGFTPTESNGITGIFLDPPYSVDDRKELYSKESFTVAHDVREWAIANGDNPMLRIALCGYDTEHQMPGNWEQVAWKAGGGYGSQSRNGHNPNAHRERLWFSPHCLQVNEPKQLELLAQDAVCL